VHSEEDDIVRINGYNIGLFGFLRHHEVEVVNLDNMRSFKAEVRGAGNTYKVRSNKVIVMTKNQRLTLGLSLKSNDVNIRIVVPKTSDELRSFELRLVALGVLISILGIAISLAN
jgi:hypothetical protein